MFEGNEYSPLEIMDSKLSSAINSISWCVANIKGTEIPKTKQKIILRSLISAQESINKALKIVDACDTKQWLANNVDTTYSVFEPLINRKRSLQHGY